MPHSQSYPVTISSLDEKIPAQPHLEETEKDDPCFSRGWCCFSIAGLISVTFILCISLIPSSSIFPIRRNLYENNLPLIQQGSLRLYPALMTSSYTNNTYSIPLPQDDMYSVVQTLQNIVKAYPNKGAVHDFDPYVQCWLQNPSFDHPCYFDPAWLGKSCTKTTNFGYEEVNGTFNPCLILKLDKTGHWRPVGDTENSVPLSWLQDFDPGFVGVSCYPKTLTDGLKVRNIRIFPKKGFSQLYFPVENFNPELYLAPLVMVQVEGVKKGENVTIECSLRAQNALFLWGYGTLTVNFVGNQNDAQSETSSSGSGGSLNNTKVQ